MLQFIKSLFAERIEADTAAIPEGERVYAIGDIHGRLDLFEALIAAIEHDDAANAPARTTVVLLGDLVDRGPHSAQVIARARQWQEQRQVRILSGNHEEMFLRSFENRDMLRHFMRHGGRETVLSFGLPRKALSTASLEELQGLMDRAVPIEVRDYLAGFEDMIRIGDYLFVHAGIDPAVPIEEQRREDLRWIREPFLSHADPHGMVVVHGHTISPQPQDRGNRIGIDTGAYSSGRLTALVLEGTSRRYIEAAEGEAGTITTAGRADAILS